MKAALKALLIKFDLGLLARVEHERTVLEKHTGRRPTRVGMIRDLISEAMNYRCEMRGDEIPTAVPAEPRKVVGEGGADTREAPLANLRRIGTGITAERREGDSQ